MGSQFSITCISSASLSPNKNSQNETLQQSIEEKPDAFKHFLLLQSPNPCRNISELQQNSDAFLSVTTETSVPPKLDIDKSQITDVDIYSSTEYSKSIERVLRYLHEYDVENLDAFLLKTHMDLDLLTFDGRTAIHVTIIHYLETANTTISLNSTKSTYMGIFRKSAKRNYEEHAKRVTAMITYLTTLGVDSDVKDGTGKSACDYAVAAQREDIATFLKTLSAKKNTCMTTKLTTTESIAESERADAFQQSVKDKEDEVLLSSGQHIRIDLVQCNATQSESYKNPTNTPITSHEEVIQSFSGNDGFIGEPPQSNKTSEYMPTEPAEAQAATTFQSDLTQEPEPTMNTAIHEAEDDEHSISESVKTTSTEAFQVQSNDPGKLKKKKKFFKNIFKSVLTKHKAKSSDSTNYTKEDNAYSN